MNLEKNNRSFRNLLFKNEGFRGNLLPITTASAPAIAISATPTTMDHYHYANEDHLSPQFQSLNRDHLAEQVFFAQHRPLGLGSLPPLVLDIAASDQLHPGNNQMEIHENLDNASTLSNLEMQVEFVNQVDKYDHSDDNQKGMLFYIHPLASALIICKQRN